METNSFLVLLVSEHVPDRAMASSDIAELVVEPRAMDTCFCTLRESGSAAGYKQLGLPLGGRRQRGQEKPSDLSCKLGAWGLRRGAPSGHHSERCHGDG